MSDFELHHRLAEDCLVVGDFPLSRLLLMNDGRYPWFILVPRRVGITEIYQLEGEDQLQLLRESSYLGRFLVHSFNGDKLNIAALGNMVPQLHLHHVVRYHDDEAWPGAVWGQGVAQPYSDAEVAMLRDKCLELGLADVPD